MRYYIQENQNNKSIISPREVILVKFFKNLLHFMNELAQNGGVSRILYLCDTFASTPDSYDKSRGDISRLGKYADTSVQYVEDKMKKSYDRVRCIEGFISDSFTQIPEDVSFHLPIFI